MGKSSGSRGGSSKSQKRRNNNSYGNNSSTGGGGGSVSGGSKSGDGNHGVGGSAGGGCGASGGSGCSSGAGSGGMGNKRQQVDSTSSSSEGNKYGGARRLPKYRWVAGTGTSVSDGSLEYEALEVKAGGRIATIRLGDSVLLYSGDHGDEEEDEEMEEEEERSGSGEGNPGDERRRQLSGKKGKEGLDEGEGSTYGEAVEDEEEKYYGTNVADENFYGVNALDPFVARVERLWEDPPPNSSGKGGRQRFASAPVGKDGFINDDKRKMRMKIRARWYFKREDIEGINGHFLGVQKKVLLNSMGPRDLVLGEQTDDNEVPTLLGRCRVVRRRPLPTGTSGRQPRGEQGEKLERDIPRGAYICRYDIRIPKRGEPGFGSVVVEPYRGGEEEDEKRIAASFEEKKPSRKRPLSQRTEASEQDQSKKSSGSRNSKRTKVIEQRLAAREEEGTGEKRKSGNEHKVEGEKKVTSTNGGVSKRPAKIVSEDCSASAEKRTKETSATHNPLERKHSIDGAESERRSDKRLKKNGNDEGSGKNDLKAADAAPSIGARVGEDRVRSETDEISNTGINSNEVVKEDVGNVLEEAKMSSTGSSSSSSSSSLPGDDDDGAIDDNDDTLSDKGRDQDATDDNTFDSEAIKIGKIKQSDQNEPKKTGVIHVGNEHQAVVPPLCSLGTVPSRRVGPAARLSWIPGRICEERLIRYLSESCLAIKNYVQSLNEAYIFSPSGEYMDDIMGDTSKSGDLVAKEGSPRKPRAVTRECNQDQLLDELHNHDYNIEAALVQVRQNPTRFLTIWTEQEKEDFDAGFSRYCGSLRMIAKSVPSHTTKEVVDYHYRFKIPSQFRKYQEMKREQARRMMSTADMRIMDGTGKPGGSTKKHRNWTKGGAAEKRRTLAKEYLIMVRDKIGEKKYADVANCLKQYHAKVISTEMLKENFTKILASHPELLERFHDFLPRKFRE